MARELGKREKTLMSKLDPADDLHQPTLGEFVAILHRLEQRDVEEILERITGMFGYGLATRPTECADHIMTGVIHAASEWGDVMRAVDEAMEDNRIDAEERASIMRECSEAKRAITALENHLMHSALREAGR